ncbi:MAG: SHOCT domain-containing protein [Actinobacteria bacterium]|nr:SHOCT domain-containing protein [Actinomycetota bacterium]
MMRRREGRPGLVGTMARTAVIAGTATAVSGGVARRQQAKAQQAADAEANQEQAAAPAPAPAGEDMVTQLKELAELKDQGILTEEEFAAQKAKILGS